MAENKISTPNSSTGIVRFYDVQSSNVQVDPKIVVIVGAAIILLTIIAKAVF